ncbi:antitoxin [Geoalkalibacter halelectricus]|uniref:antitoxin n=1 Tax=Geoalkalibacter halelectricus TaxID=2847045 RepID=UPI003D2194A9
MPKTAKLFKNGGSQAVRLPSDFRFPGDEVIIERVGDRVILRPKPTNWDDFFARKNKVPDDFMKNHSDPAPEDRDLF